MQERPFVDKSHKPTGETLQTILGSRYLDYQKIINLVSAFSQEWTYSKSSGWMLKIYDRKKALFYLIPLTEGFKISLAIRENERETFLCDVDLKIMRDKILSAKKYPEGFSIQLDVINQNEFQSLELLIGKLITIRS